MTVIKTKYSRNHPFTRCIVTGWDELEGKTYKEKRWRPGAWATEYLQPDDACQAAHSEGECIFRVKGEYKPGRYPNRIFFTQQFIDPDGNTMKESYLRIKTQSAFLNQVKKFPFEYSIIPEETK